MSESQPRLIASVSIVLPNRQIDGRWQSGKMITAGKEIPTEGLDQSHIDNYLKAGTAYWKDGAVPLLKDVEATRSEGVNVSAKVNRAGEEVDNPLDDGIDLVPSGADPELDAKLLAIAEKQKSEGVENDGDDLHEDETVEVNLGTGEVTKEGGEPSFEEEADSQVSN